MDYKGVIITGTSGSGKSSIAKLLCKINSSFEVVTATTTRVARTDDFNYVYITKHQFERKNKKNEFLIDVKYRDEFYAISKQHLNEVLKKGKVPILIIAPESIKNPIINNGLELKFLSFYIDTTDEELINRIEHRDGNNNVQDEVIRRNDLDRVFKVYSDYELIYKNSHELSSLVELIIWLWESRNNGGILPYQIIKSLIEYAFLVETDSVKYDENISAASYDLTLGNRYFQNGRIKSLSNNSPTIIIKPGDFIIAESKEKINMPSSVAGRFDLTVSMFCNGLILSNGPQVDPGFRGKLFCLLFNTSNKDVELWKGQHYATIEFIKLIEASKKPYNGSYQQKEDIIEYLRITTSHSVIHQLKDDVNTLKKDQWWLKYLPLVISLVALLIAILKIIEVNATKISK